MNGRTCEIALSENGTAICVTLCVREEGGTIRAVEALDVATEAEVGRVVSRWLWHGEMPA